MIVEIAGCSYPCISNLAASICRERFFGISEAMDKRSLIMCLDLLQRADELLMADIKDLHHAAKLAMVIDGLLAEYRLPQDIAAPSNDLG